MGAKRKPWKNIAAKQKKIIVGDVVHNIQSHCQDAADVRELLSGVRDALNTQYPLLQLNFGEMQVNDSLLHELGKVRATVPTTIELAKPTISVSQMDAAVLTLGMSFKELINKGYEISVRAFSSTVPGQIDLAEGRSLTNKGGRKSLVDDPDIVQHVRATLSEHIVDTERVAVIGRGRNKRMTVAQHLQKKKYRLFMEAPALHGRMSWKTFHKILRKHFPQIRNPIRKTDVCEHCKHLERRLLPKALKAMEKARADLCAIWPAYFHSFDSNKVIQSKMLDKDKIPLVARFVAYVNSQNFHAGKNASRAQALGLSAKLSLHSTEARIIHNLKGHVELLEAYRWHQISARRQANSLTNLQSGGLAANEALIQVDFKENVRYPLSALAVVCGNLVFSIFCFLCFCLSRPAPAKKGPKQFPTLSAVVAPLGAPGCEETGDEWHAQNKLSLTVFGVTAFVPNKSGSHIHICLLIVSEVLDHDAQMANMLINWSLIKIREQPARFASFGFAVMSVPIFVLTKMLPTSWSRWFFGFCFEHLTFDLAN